MIKQQHETAVPVVVSGWHEHTDGSRGRYAITTDRRAILLEVEWRCAHCGLDITVNGRPDSGGSCPRCDRYLCRQCAGGWCSSQRGGRV